MKVGEHISVPYSNSYTCYGSSKCTFRVVSKDFDSVKVIINGTNIGVISFNTNGDYYTSSATINSYLVSFANGISDIYRYSGNKNFNVGPCTRISNYTCTYSNTYSGNVGLPVVGEMFSGNDIEIGRKNNRIFTDPNTILTTSTNAFWVMNYHKQDYISPSGIDEHGLFSGYYHADTKAIRPVIFLNKNLTFTQGDGTAGNPYQLGN